MKTIDGISASPGIAFGEAYVYADEVQKIPHYRIEKDRVDHEFDRFTKAVEQAVREIEVLKQGTNKDVHPDEVTMLDTHLLMLSDPEFTDQVEKRLKQTLENVEYVLSVLMQELISKLSQTKDEYIRERAADFHDVGKRVIYHLMNRERRSIAELDSDIILICKDLLPSDAIAMDKIRVKAIAMDQGGKTSHTAILARAFEIPAVLGLGEMSLSVRNGDIVIVDGNKGRVIVNPDQDTLDFYAKRQREFRKREVSLMSLNELPAETTDGKVILLKGNIEIPEEVDAVLSHGASGIGLFRSEFLFLRSAALPDEEEQFEAYKRVLEAMGDKPVTIRTLDIGGDKLLRNMRAVGASGDQGLAAHGGWNQMPFTGVYNEKNPILGWRAIRFCLSHEELFKTQLRAILRASIYGNLRVMFPLISGTQELTDALTIFEEVKGGLRKKRIPYKDDVPVGIMIEVPSAAITSDILARRSQFFSIGTNDLIQYTIAVDRGNEHTAYLYDPLHPGVLRLLKMVIDNAHRRGIPVGMCGEMAGDPLHAMVLLGLGLDEFSMSSFGIPEVKRIIRSTSIAEAEEFVGKILDMSSAAEIESFVRARMEEQFEITHY